jgi:hypothetical protein
MKVPARSLIVCSLLVLTISAVSAHDAEIREYTIRRDRVTATAMGVLGSWSIANMAVGTTRSLTADDPQRAAFHQMNAGWNIVNAALAIPGFIGARRNLSDPPALTLSESLTEQNRLEDTLLFNAGIDFAYIATGFYLVERSRRGEADAARFTGFGRSLMLQGGFLLAFDLTVYLLQRRTGRELFELADR